MKLLTLSLMLMLAGCTSLTPESEEPQNRVEANPWTLGQIHIKGATAQQAAPLALPAWQHYLLPGKKATVFSYEHVDGRDAMAVQADASASMLRQSVRLSPNELGKLTFSWKVPALIASADMALIDADDSPVRMVLAFEGDRTLFSTKNAMLSELSHALTGEPLPYATLMYVWCNTCAAGTVIVNPRTDRIRKLVVESGNTHLNQWKDYERDIRADFEAAFGEAPGALLALGIMTDSDNTRSTARAWYGPIRLIAGH